MRVALDQSAERCGALRDHRGGLAAQQPNIIRPGLLHLSMQPQERVIQAAHVRGRLAFLIPGTGLGEAERAAEH